MAALSLALALGSALLSPETHAQTISVKGKLLKVDGTAKSSTYVYCNTSDWRNYQTDYTDSNGVFELYDLAAATYTCTISIWSGYDQAPDPIANVIVKSGETTDLGNISLVKPNIEARLLKADGTALSSGYAYVNNSSGSVYKSNSSDSNGYIYFYMSQSGTYRFQAYDQWTGSTYIWAPAEQNFEHNPSNGTNLGNIKYANANVTGTLTKPDGTAVKDAYVYWSYSTNGKSQWASAVTDSSGKFNLYSRYVGDYTLQIYGNNSSYGDPDKETVAVSQNVVSGTETLTLNRSLLAPNVLIKVQDPAGATAVADAYIYLYRGAWLDYKYCKTDSNGYCGIIISKADTYHFTFY